jgi:hypothetical protein
MITKETLTGQMTANKLAIPLEFTWSWLCVRRFLHQSRGVFITGRMGLRAVNYRAMCLISRVFREQQVQ